MKKILIGIIGAGDIGLNLAEILAIKNYDVIIFNRYHEVAGDASPYWLSKMGKIMDMNDSLQIPGCGNVTLTSELDDLKKSSIVVITAGAKRKNPEETREELAGKNALIIENYVDFLSNNQNILALIISNPVDFLTQYLISKLSERLNISKEIIAKKIVGVSYIDSMRLKNLVKEFLIKYHPEYYTDNINAIAIGEHGPSMVPLMSNLTISDLPIENIANISQINYIKEHTILRGNDIIKLTGASSIMGPAHAVMHMIEEICSKDHTILPCSVWDGERAIGRVARFESNSFIKIEEVQLDEQENKMFEISKQNLDKQYNNIINLLKSNK